MQETTYESRKRSFPSSQRIALFVMLQLLLLGCFGTHSVFAQKASHTAKAPHIQVSLVAQEQSVQPGRPFWVAIRQQLDPAWHTYWRNPGDSGFAPKTRWRLPQGFKASAIHWPAPHKIITGQLANFGYAHEVYLLTRITPPAKITASSIKLQAVTSWLVCEEECIPGRATLALTLPVKNEAPASNPAHKAAFARWQKALPRSVASLSVQAQAHPKTVVLAIKGLPSKLRTLAHRIDFFPKYTATLQNAPEPARAQHHQTLLLRYKRNEYFKPSKKPLEGILVFRPRSAPKHHGAQPAALAVYRISTPFVAAVPSVQALFKAAPKTAPTSRKTSLSSRPSSVPALSSKDKNHRAMAASRNKRNKAEARTAALSSLCFGSQQQAPGEGWWFLLQALFLAFLGGMVLNVMPCVFPIISLKILHFVQMSDEDAGQVRKHGFAYTFGVMLSFTLLAGSLLLLRAGGNQFGWGFQLQTPGFVLTLVLLLFLMGLSLSGFFELGSSWAGVGESLAARGGYSGSFFTGMLATIVATPCTAPFMGVAIAYALSQPPLASLLIFNALGFGMAFPYLLLTFLPKLLRKLPRPGTWMITFKEFMAFPLYATVLWLLWVLSKQAGQDGVLLAVASMLLLSFAIWMHKAGQRSGFFRVIRRITTPALFLLTCWLGYTTIGDIATRYQDQQAKRVPPKQAYTPAKLNKLIADREHFFLNLTAAWCISCKANERVALKRRSVQEAMARKKVHYLVGDWTNNDPAITKLLTKFNRDGVPLYVLYNGQDGTCQVLPQLLTPSIVKDAINKM